MQYALSRCKPRREESRLEERGGGIVGELDMCRPLGIKPNFGVIARRHGLDGRTVAGF